jgi:hypothetical protein
VRVGPGVRASMASLSHRTRRRSGRAGRGAWEKTIWEKEERERMTHSPPPVIERKGEGARWACWVVKLGRLVGRPVGPRGLDQKLRVLVCSGLRR